MSATSAHAMTGLLAIGGFVLLALAMPRHQDDLFGRAWSASRSRWWRMTGFVALGLSLGAAVDGLGPSVGVVAWCGHLSLAAGIVAVTLLTIGRRGSDRR